MATEFSLPGAGECVDGFTLGPCIHDGQMARIHRVEHGDSPFPLLMKLPKAGFGSHPACIAGFDAETMIAETLSGRAFPRHVAHGTRSGCPYLVIEEVAGESLAAWSRRAPLAAAEVAAVMGPVAAAVHTMHRQDVVHHDLKPDNILIRADGSAALIDFGLAHHSCLPDLVAEEMDGTDAAPPGTAAYLAPEQLRGVRGDPRSDLFALGVILYHLATGSLPFGAPQSATAARRRLYLDPPPPRTVNPGVPEWLQEIILHCLEIDPAARYASAAQLAQDLAHPELLPLGERARKSHRDGPGRILRRWIAAQWRPPRNDSSTRSTASDAVAGTHVLVALDLAGSPLLLSAIRDEVARIAASRACRITCVTVHEPSAFSDGSDSGETAHGMNVPGLIELRHWAAGLDLSPARLRCHVIAGVDTAGSLIEYAGLRHVDLIVLGARGSSGMRRLIGSVSARVAAEAPCSVSIVRAPNDPDRPM